MLPLKAKQQAFESIISYILQMQKTSQVINYTNS